MQTNFPTQGIRMIAFAIGESFYDVQDGKNMGSRWVRCEVYFLQFDADFDLEGWRRHSVTLDAQTKKATEDFIHERTVNLRG